MSFLDKIKEMIANQKEKREVIDLGAPLELENELLNYFEAGHVMEVEQKELSEGVEGYDIYVYDKDNKILYRLQTDAIGEKEERNIEVLEKIYRVGDAPVKQHINTAQGANSELLSTVLYVGRIALEMQKEKEVEKEENGLN
ncbi:MAG: hypothetical protein J6K97_01420 [Clostridia bacterium]|nr:hypothetical protein [Clostridia bacterium]